MTSANPGRSAQRCSTCGAVFECGAAASTPCWCTRLPSLSAAAIASGAGCLCEDCLRRRIDQPTAATPLPPD